MGLTFHGVGHVHANGHRALAGVQLRIAAGEQVALIGSSGAGKTTLLRVAGCALRPTEGAVSVLDTSPWSLSARALRRLRARIGLVHQAPPIPPRLRVITAVLAGRLASWSTARAVMSLLYPADIPGARDTLSRLGLADRLFDRCDRLSGGQLQRVAVARVLYQQPALMLADEPVSSLDPATATAVIEELVARSRATGATLVASVHAVDLALTWFPRVIGMKGGAVVFDLPAGDVTPALLQDLYGSEPPRVPEPVAATPVSLPMCR